MTIRQDSAQPTNGNHGALTVSNLQSSKVIAVHLNYRSRAAQRGRTPDQPSYFLKPATSLAQSGECVERPAGTELLSFEGEIALVIGRQARRVGLVDAWSHVEYVTAANDLGVYDLRYADRGSNLRSKGGDGFTPIGPTLIDARTVDPHRLRLRTWLNGTVVQDDDTTDLLFPFPRLIADLSQLITLRAGDIILTGTPAGASVLRPSDVVEVDVSSLDSPNISSGRLRTGVVQGEIAFASFGAQPIVDDDERSDAWGSSEAAGLSAGFDLSSELRSKLQSVGTATLSAQLRKRGLNCVTIDGLTATRPQTKMIGRARTLRFVPFREDLFARRGGGFNAQKEAFDTLKAGDVLVIEARGERGSGTLGDILALRAQTLGAAGIVTDGGVRDLETVGQLTLCTYHAGGHPSVLGRRHVPWDTDITISCGGATVEPGDVIVGDADGLVVIPPDFVAEVVNDAIRQELEEAFIASQVAAGASVNGLYPMNDGARVAFEHWRVNQQPMPDA
jgi:2-keto-4-pentenoate hydratase/2-oxohepta-3-ene-1,7-dioic acid hydratase in catechol pathway/regulator of RNase E activity RraA